MKLNIVLPVAAALVITGCATVTVTEPSVVNEKVGKIPPLETVATAPVGGVVFSQFKYWSKVGYRLSGNFSAGLALGRVNVSEGDFVVKANVDGGTAYCTEKSAYIDPLTGPYKTACFIDADSDGNFEKMKAAPGAVWFEKNISPPLRYEKADFVIPRADSSKFELLYQGVSSGSLKLSYREYLNDFARPAFFQDVTYDMTEKPMLVTFRTVRIEVREADNNKIVYRVLSGF